MEKGDGREIIPGGGGTILLKLLRKRNILSVKDQVASLAGAALVLARYSASACEDDDPKWDLLATAGKKRGAPPISFLSQE
jgi:hypothetical protein